MRKAQIPDEPLIFIRDCITSGRVRWTYHVTMRLQERRLNSDVLRKAVATLEIVEAYGDDKYSRIRFSRACRNGRRGDNVRVVTMYRPDPEQWNADRRVRRSAK